MADLLSTEVLDSARVMEYTQQTRLNLIKDLTKNATQPEDPKSQKVLLEALNGMDKAVVTIERIKLEEKAIDLQAAAASLIAAVIRTPGIKNIFTNDTLVEREIPSLPNNLDAIVTVAGETSNMPMNESYAEFMSKTNVASEEE